MESRSNQDIPVTVKQEPSTSTSSSSNSNKATDRKFLSDYKNFVSSGTYPPGGRRLGGGARLPSLRSPRDLTLGGSNPPTPASRQKKVFVPNVTQKRVKTENNILESRSDKSARNRNEHKNKNKGKGREKFQKEIIQTKGTLFSVTMGAPNPRKGYGGMGGGGGYGGGGGKGEANVMQKPVINPNVLKTIDDEHEEQKLKELLRDDFIENEGLRSSLEESDLPLQLPLKHSGGIFHQSSDDNIKVKPKAKPMRLEDSDDDDLDQMKSESIPQQPVMSDPFRKEPQMSLSDLLTKDHDDLILFQLPTSLPSFPSEMREAMVKKEPTESSSNDTLEVSFDKKINLCSTLHDVSECEIGTIKIHKSGKAVLWLGDHRLVINKGTQVSFLQDAAKLDVDEESKSGSMTIVGHVKHRLTVTPVFEDILANS